MKFVVRINPETLKDESFPYLEPGRVPPIVDPEEPEKAKDGGVAKPVKVPMKKRTRKKPS
jgi:hypothetical protein